MSKNRTSDGPAVTRELIERYFHGLSDDEISLAAGAPPETLVSEHIQFGAVRIGDQSLIRIFEPSVAEADDATVHSVVEIVTDDIPFLVDSVTMAFDRHDVRLLSRVHPVFNIRRDIEGNLLEINSTPQSVAGFQRESFMRFQIELILEEQTRKDLEKGLRRALADVTATSRDRKSIHARVIDILSTIGSSEEALGSSSGHYIDRDEMAAFLRWVSADHFVFLGYLNLQAEDNVWKAKDNSGLGILSNARLERLKRLVPVNDSAQSLEEMIQITKGVERSRVHRDVWIDVIVVTVREGDHFVRHAIVGLFTSIAYGLRPEAIPYLRSKVDYVMRASELPAGGFGFRTLRDVLTHYPRNELFQASPELLLQHAQEILQIQARPRTLVLLRRDDQRDVDVCIVYLQRDRYSREVRLKIENKLKEIFGSERIDYETHMDTSSLAYVYFLIHAASRRPDTALVQSSIVETTTEWRQLVATSLTARNANADIIARFADGFPTAYVERFSAEDAAADAIRMAYALEHDSLGIYVYDNDVTGSAGLGLRLYSPDSAIALSAILPQIENLGFEVGVERPYEIRCTNGSIVWIHDFSVRSRTGKRLDTVEAFERIEAALQQMWAGSAENDRFNQLVQFAELTWREASLVRALCRFLRQTRIAYGENYMIDALVRNPQIVAELVRLFMIRFDPQRSDPAQRDESAKTTADAISQQLDEVESLDEDRILRALFNATQAIVRTNYFKGPAANDTLYETLTFKFDSAELHGLPLPRPLFEIFVYSPHFEGIHLRAGKVARGGLRWSDRREDFRTEVLGLMKAQVVKNAVIVPVGSKGGFIVRKAFEQPPTLDRDGLTKEVMRCYRSFISSMLDVTDNLVDGSIVAPRDVVRHDPDDPYLVVAADKGTATFSDLANEVSQQHEFWLDDAFASGGRTGYDHKVMGITARGAWESVKRHFRGLGKDIQNEPFSVVGIGDMSGDVFGNGMLLSRHICLVAAFNHRHIFIDPKPDPISSWTERERLFALPRSGWDDYDPALLSTGGGIYSRSAKSIKLNEQTAELLGTDATEIAPNDLIHLLLQIKVDLLWNGGIGTYVKASSESHDDAADRSSDALRVDGKQLGARVVGEGGNLGLTQLGRVEFCQHGGNCFTDFVDNAAGVHSSDYEVNIKVLLNGVVARGDLTEDGRNELLASMTDEVASLVLRENYKQTRSLDYALYHGDRLFPEQTRLLRAQEASGRLDRQVEYLPSREEVAERGLNGTGFTAPEIAVLQAYAKMELYDELLASALPDDPWLLCELVDYFPKPLVTRYKDDFWAHPLRRELVSTQITNLLIDSTHAGFVQRLRELSDASTEAIARAFMISRSLFDLDSHHELISSLDNKVNTDVQNEMLMCLVKLTENSMLKILNRPATDSIESALNVLQAGVNDFAHSYNDYLPTELEALITLRADSFEIQQVPADIARTVSALPLLARSLDTIALSNESKVDLNRVARIYFETSDLLNLDLLDKYVDALKADSEWHIAAKARLRRNLASQKQGLILRVLGGEQHLPVKDMSAGIFELLGPEANRLRDRIAGLNDLADIDFAVCTVAVDDLAMLRNSRSAA